jgi:monoamine oxidase
MDGEYDVVVVGGGVAGTYAAWRLATGPASGGPLPPDPADRKIALYELSNRIGGRLESLTPPGAPNLRAEFGGMGFTSANAIVTALVDDVFKLPAEPFDMGTSANLIYVRAVHFTKAQAGDPSVVPYKLAPSEQGKNPVQLIVDAIEAVLPGASSFTPAQWAKVKKTFVYQGRHLKDIGFWNFLSMNMSNEAFAYAHDGIGHFFQVSNWNCAEALPWFLGDGTAAYRTLVDGYEQLPLTLAQAFRDAGGNVYMETRVATVTQDGALLQVELDGSPAVSAQAVVLALPRRALELLGPESAVLSDPTVKRLVDTVSGHRVMKIFCCYDAPWWSPLGITGGGSATDLPIGNVWYWGPNGDGNESSLLLASYNDTLATTYWEGLASGPRFAGSPETTVDPYWAEQAPSDLMVQEVQRQLAEMHQLDVPTPYSAAFKDWSHDPYGGAFYTWNVGVDAEAVARKMPQPDPAVPLFVCGESYSHDQGWAEGALDTAEQVVEKLGLEPPAWLAPEKPS